MPDCDAHLKDLVLAELDDYHPTAIQEPDDKPQLRAFFATAAARDQAAHALAAAFGSHLFVEPVDVNDEDWAARSQASLPPVTVGRITVAAPAFAPSTFTPADGATVAQAPLLVVIEPSMGFGTGHHATTRLMLAALQQLDVRNRTVIDVGCGSGVLAIASVLLGARFATAVDNDPDALNSAGENVGRNGVADHVRLLNVDLKDLTDPADIVLANLTGGVLERNAQSLTTLVAPSGHLVVSGVMDTESSVIPALERFLRLERVVHEDEWMCALFSKNPSTRTAAPQSPMHRQRLRAAPGGRA